MLIAAAAFYLTRLRAMVLDVFADPAVHIYHPKDGRSALYLPLIFMNKSDTDGSILKVFIRLTSPSGSVYFLRWREFGRYFWREEEYKNSDDVAPFSIKARTTETRFIWFYWAENETIDLEFVSGDWQLDIYVWTKNQKRHTFHRKQKFIVTDHAASVLAERRKDNNPKTRIVFFPGHANIGARNQDDIRNEHPWG